MAGYVRWLRERVGHEPVFLNAACGILVNEKGEVLLQRRGGEKEDSWGLPGGMMEIGEKPRETVVREFLEETGLEVEVGRFVGVYTDAELTKYPNSDMCQLVTQVFVCKRVKGELQVDGDETLELKYFDIKNRPTLYNPHIERAITDYGAGNLGVSN